MMLARLIWPVMKSCDGMRMIGARSEVLRTQAIYGAHKSKEKIRAGGLDKETRLTLVKKLIGNKA